MENEVPNKVLVGKIRNSLKTSKVQLWVAPYITPEGNSNDEVLQELAASFSAELGLAVTDTLATLKYLQQHSLLRLEQNQLYRTERIATLHIKIGDKSQLKELKNPAEIVQTKLDVTGESLMELVKEQLGVQDLFVKVVCNGKVIEPDKLISEQGVGHNKTLFCMIVHPENQGKMQQLESIMGSIKGTKRGAELLAGNSSALTQGMGAQILDQSGRSLDIPDEENEALVVALSLHKRGQAFLKKQDYKSALLFLLEADDQFKICSGSLLQMVDNYAILNLDISWCYLALKSLDALTDVTERLAKSEEFFNKSYGQNLQRLYALKGSTGEEIALFVRLYTLQGVAAFHNDQFQEAVERLKKADAYISTLNIDDTHLTRLLELGFEPIESKQALRASNGNIQKAIDFAYKKREEKEKIKKDEEEKARRRKLAKKLGKCKNGDRVDLDAYYNMVNNLGFEKGIVAEALKKHNNDIAESILAIQTHFEELQEAAKLFAINQSGYKRLTAMGYDLEAAKATLQHFTGDVTKAMEYLISSMGEVPSAWTDLLRECESLEQLPKLSAEEEQAFHDLVEVVDEEDSYEDILGLYEERAYIDQYLTLIQGV